MSELHYINGLKEGNRDTVYQIYKKYLPNITSWMLKNSGNEQDAYDIFQDALEVIVEKSFSADWTLEMPFGAYLFRICRNKWISTLREKNKEEQVRNYEYERYTSEAYDKIFESEQMAFDEKIKEMLSDTFDALSPLCQKLIPLTESKVSAKEIAETLQMTNANTVHRRKFACFKAWKKLVMEHKYYPIWKSRS